MIKRLLILISILFTFLDTSGQKETCKSTKEISIKRGCTDGGCLPGCCDSTDYRNLPIKSIVPSDRFHEVHKSYCENGAGYIVQITRGKRKGCVIIPINEWDEHVRPTIWFIDGFASLMITADSNSNLKANPAVAMSIAYKNQISVYESKIHYKIAAFAGRKNNELTGGFMVNLRLLKFTENIELGVLGGYDLIAQIKYYRSPVFAGLSINYKALSW